MNEEGTKKKKKIRVESCPSNKYPIVSFTYVFLPPRPQCKLFIFDWNNLEIELQFFK